jgi:hypothetical protein
MVKNEGSPTPRMYKGVKYVNGKRELLFTFENLPCVQKSLILSILEGLSPPPWVLLVEYPLMSKAHLPNNFRPVGNKISWSKMVKKWSKMSELK